jgi:hypothetical protein
VSLAAFVGFKPKAPAQAVDDAFDLDAFLNVAAMFQS